MFTYGVITGMVYLFLIREVGEIMKSFPPNVTSETCSQKIISNPNENIKIKKSIPTHHEG